MTTISSFKTLALAGLLIAANLLPGAEARVGLQLGNTEEEQQQQQRGLQSSSIPDSSGAVYVMTNRVGGIGNSVLAFDRDAVNGRLSRVGLYDTGGLGGTVGVGNGLTPPDFAGQTPATVIASPNDALASQNSLILSESGRCLFAVNAGSDTITTFAIRNNGRFLDRVGVYPSGGNFPLSVSQRGNIVYVLNAGGEGNISGFRYGDRLCTLAALPGTTRSLDNIDFNPPSILLAPGQVSITPSGQGVIATIKGTNSIHYWSLSALGFPSDSQIITPSNGFTPFSFTFDGNGNLLVAEAFGASSVGQGLAGAVSSYAINEDEGTLTLISGSVPTVQTATCWVRYSNGMAYTSNNANPTPSVSTLSVDSRGRLALIDSAAAGTAEGIDRPIDIDLSDDGEFLYVLNTGTLVNGAATPQISVFSTGGGTGLELVETFDQGLPSSTSSSNAAFEDTEGVFGLAVL